MNLDLSTWATRSCGSTIGIVIPSVVTNVLHRDSVNPRIWNAAAEVKTGGSIDIYQAPKGWRNAAAKQQAFLRKEDAETRRISYLYDNAEESDYGQFRHQVFVPTPRPTDIESSSDDGRQDYESASTSRSSSPESGRTQSPTFVKSRSRKTSTIPRERDAQAAQSDSDSDGVDSASTCSSTSDTELPGISDLSTKLANQLRQIRGVRQSMHDPDVQDGPEESLPSAGSDLPPAVIGNGSIIKVSLRPVELSLQPTALVTCSNLLVAFKEVVSQT